MTCQEFKERMVELFDRHVDSQIKKECEQHIAHCAACRKEYEELKETFDFLQDKGNSSKSVNINRHTNEFKEHRNQWKAVIAAAAIFLLGIVVGWNRLFSIPANANDTYPSILSQSIMGVQHVGNWQMDIYTRTTPEENFSYLDAEEPFVKIKVQVLRQDDSTFYRVEKEQGRTVVFDGQKQYMWAKKYFVSGTQRANFLEKFAPLISPYQLLSTLQSAINLSHSSLVKQVETDSTIVLLFEGNEKNSNLEELLQTGRMSNQKIFVENTFSKKDKMLRGIKVYCKQQDKEKVLLYSDNIKYNTALSKSDIVALPQTTKWQTTDHTNYMTKKEVKLLRKETDKQAAQRILHAIISGNKNMAAEALYSYEEEFDDLHRQLKDCTVSNFQTRKDDSYKGVYVYFTLKKPDGTSTQKYIAIRNDNDQKVWTLDGGF